MNSNQERDQLMISHLLTRATEHVSEQFALLEASGDQVGTLSVVISEGDDAATERVLQQMASDNEESDNICIAEGTKRLAKERRIPFETFLTLKCKTK